MAENSFAAEVTLKKYSIQYFVPLISYKTLNMFNGIFWYNKYDLLSFSFALPFCREGWPEENLSISIALLSYIPTYLYVKLKCFITL